MLVLVLPHPIAASDTAMTSAMKGRPVSHITSLGPRSPTTRGKHPSVSHGTLSGQGARGTHVSDVAMPPRAPGPAKPSALAWTNPDESSLREHDTRLAATRVTTPATPRSQMQ
jgi:hypothetical protein